MSQSGHLANAKRKKGCAWLGQERQQAPYAPHHSRQDARGRTRLPSRRQARISAAIRLVLSFFLHTFSQDRPQARSHRMH
jgi:hypothetical protein